MTAHPNRIIPLLLVMTALGLVSTPLAATAQTLQPQVLFNFTRDPANPQANLVQGPDGTFYGTTVGGGGGDSGTVFKMTTNGALTTLVNFTRANGASPHAGLALGSDGSFYGTTSSGGSSNLGTVFKVTTNGALTKLVNFTNGNGANPYEGLVLGSDGSFYGTTYYGGSGGAGVIFRLVLRPAIISQPASRTNGVGTTATFTVTATGIQPFSYQWLKNGTNLVNGGNVSGANTNTLTLANVQTNDTGNFAVVVTNSWGSVTSSVAVLTVVVPSSITLSSAMLTNRIFYFSFTNTPGASFSVLTTTNLSLPFSNWTTLIGVVEAPPGKFQFTDPQATNSPQRFYRVRSP